MLSETLCHIDTAAYDDDVNILVGTLQKHIAYITSYNIAGHVQLIGGLAQQVKNAVIQFLFDIVLRQMNHIRVRD
jgi:hypothetical protein